jgi:hypothetical protein
VLCRVGQKHPKNNKHYINPEMKPNKNKTCILLINGINACIPWLTQAISAGLFFYNYLFENYYFNGVEFEKFILKNQ